MPHCRPNPRTRCVLHPEIARSASLTITSVEFTHAFHRREWEVETNLDHYHLHDVLPSQKPSAEAAAEINGDSEGEGGEEEEDSDGVPSKSKGPAPFPGNISPRKLWDLKRALIIKNSHIGGHKFAGNVIVSEQPRFCYLAIHGIACAFSFRFFAPRALGLDTDPVTLWDGVWLPHSLPDVTPQRVSPQPPPGLPKSDLGIQLGISSVRRRRDHFEFLTRYLSPLVPLSLNSGPDPISGATLTIRYPFFPLSSSV